MIKIDSAYANGDAYRKQYADGISAFLEARRAASHEKRAKFAQKIQDDPDTYREKFKEMLGYPLGETRPASVNIRSTPIPTQEPDITLTRMEFEVFPGLWFYGILFLHRDVKNADGTCRPFFLSQHGGGGTPELCSGLLDSTYNYNDMTERIFRMGANVFAPQMLLCGYETGDENVKPLERAATDSALKQVGSSITATELYCLQTVLDYFEKQPYVDADQIGMAGLSYGGFYTLFLTALDTRIKRALSVCFFNDRYALNWLDWTWFDAGNTFLDAEVALLCAGRPLTVVVGDHDPVFTVDGAKAEYKRLAEYLRGRDTSWLTFTVFDGEHEFVKEDAVIRQALFDGWL